MHDHTLFYVCKSPDQTSHDQATSKVSHQSGRMYIAGFTLPARSVLPLRPCLRERCILSRASVANVLLQLGASHGSLVSMSSGSSSGCDLMRCLSNTNSKKKLCSQCLHLNFGTLLWFLSWQLRAFFDRKRLSHLEHWNLPALFIFFLLGNILWRSS